ncbi:MAG: acetyl-CoA hydrolase/transferase family protein [Butyricimonas faecalis]
MTWKYTTCYVLVTELIPNRKCYPIFGTTPFRGRKYPTSRERGSCGLHPCFFHELPHFFRNGTLPVDVAIVHLSTPDEEGYCSFGVSSDYTKPAAHAARVVIAEVNDRMPHVGGDNHIHVSELDYIVETSNPLFEIPLPKIGETEQAIGRYCAELIEDGSTLQLGIGAIPDAVLQCLQDKKDLGIHTEMFSDGVIDLVEKGVITGKCKTLHPGKLVATFLMGSQRLYDFVDNNPDVALFPVDYVNDPYVIRQNRQLISINSCIEIDLSGQVCSETIGPKQFSGTGGQVDYIRGQLFPKAANPSWPCLPRQPGEGFPYRTLPGSRCRRHHLTKQVDYVVTEYGIAHLKGKTLRQRAESLIRIAHPDFRESLTEEFFHRFPLALQTI